MSSLPWPQLLLGTALPVPVCASLRAVACRPRRICSWRRVGFFSRIRATVPATMGVDMLVPAMSW